MIDRVRPFLSLPVGNRMKAAAPQSCARFCRLLRARKANGFDFQLFEIFDEFVIHHRC
jgi:hypothetical protein